MASLGIVLKTVEICNLNCSYCYFFNGIDASYKKHPAYISRATIESVVSFLQQGVEELQLDRVKIGFHGGEPLLQDKKEFDWMCQYFISRLSPYTNLRFSIQTNGIPINTAWIDLIEKYGIHVGVSIDGPKAHHDLFRVDHRGKGSYDKVVDRINFFNQEAKKRGIQSLGALSVINPMFHGGEIYRHFVDHIGLSGFNFLLPDHNYHTPPPYPAERYGQFMCEVFNEWTKDDNPDISITFINSSLGIFNGGEGMIYGIGPTKDIHAIPLITIASNGDLSPVDELRSTDPSIMHSCNVASTTLKDFLAAPIFKEIAHAQHVSPLACQSCCWENVCGSGGIVNRFSKENRFDNPSIYCDGLSQFYTKLAAYMIKNNFPLQQVENTLFI